MNQKKEVDFLKICLYIGLCTFLVFSIFWALDYSHRYTAYIDHMNKICNGSFIKGRGDINYCAGRPIICSEKGCMYVSAYEDCYPVVLGRTVITKCDLVQLNN